MQYTICLAADENYIKYASVVISSIINNIEENSQDNFVFYLFNNGLSSQCTLQIKNLERRLNDRCQVKIQLCSADESLFKKFPGWGTSIKGQYMTYFRFFMADFIPANIEKCLYLDSDIVVTGDIRPLFKEDLKDCILGGVRDLS